MGDTTQTVHFSDSVADLERQELAAVLASPAFARSSRLVKLLEFITDKYFQDQSSQVCEYSIATEVLGRGPDFDPSEDAIARVEIHRLRKKLREYYAAEGSQQGLKIIIPPGMYTPVFQRDGSPVETVSAVRRPPAGPVEDAPGESPREPVEGPAPPALAGSPGRRRYRAWLLAAGVLVVVGGTVAVWRAAAREEPVAPPRLPPAPVGAAPDSGIRIIAGYDRKYIDHQGHTWLPDQYFEGGGKPGAPFRQFISRTSDPLLYQNGRIGLTAYNIPVKSGTYELKLHFVEPIYGPGLETGGGENSRVFDILVNGKVMVDSMDVVSDAGGPLTADVRVFKDIQPGPDGFLRVSFHAKREQPLINAIEVEPAAPHRMNPVRLVTQANSVTDSRGQVWEADNYFIGGQNSNHYKAVTGSPDGDLFANERYGHFSYAIPVAPGGSYTATMYFAETYWGKGNQGGGGPGQRLFDVYCGGTTLIRNLDILQEVPPNHALIKKFHGLHPNAQGKLNFEFVPSMNYASIFAIEVLDEGR